MWQCGQPQGSKLTGKVAHNRIELNCSAYRYQWHYKASLNGVSGPQTPEGRDYVFSILTFYRRSKKLKIRPNFFIANLCETLYI